MVVVVAAPPNAEDVRDAEKRRARLLSALTVKGISQADLLRVLYEAGEKTSPSTVSNWCRGAAAISEIQVRGLLSLIGLEPEWKPTAEMEKRALAEAEARARIPKDKRRRRKAQ